jgi:hypothetical protein
MSREEPYDRRVPQDGPIMSRTWGPAGLRGARFQVVFARSRSAGIGWDLWGFLPHFLPQIANGSRGSHALESAEPARARPRTPKPLSRAARIDRSDCVNLTATAEVDLEAGPLPDNPALCGQGEWREVRTRLI